ncbi:MAG: lipid-A-disaccharide synthase [Gammaproteobacteria bacterium TMED78]|nr:MAG: lipid-A-disaccharide synthase [Gammaproteobacteria bacterium TMED78]
MRISFKTKKKYKIAICAGEASGDNLGAELIKELKALLPNIEFFGVAGQKMISQGCVPLYRVEQLSVMGLFEVLKHLPRILWLRYNLINKIKKIKPDVFIGIDSPDFNLLIGDSLKKANIPVVQYVSPQVWAWRQSRVKKIKKSVDLILCLLPFEKIFYDAHGISSFFVGHPIADQIPENIKHNLDRKAFSIDENSKVLAILPGSRSNEIHYLAEPFIETAKWLISKFPDLLVLITLSNSKDLDLFLSNNINLKNEVMLDRRYRFIIGKSRMAISASNVVLTASGTASLEAALIKKPMVVAYIVSDISFWLFNKLGLKKLKFFSLPNLLTQSSIVPEYVQNDVKADIMGRDLEGFLNNNNNFEKQKEIFVKLHHELKMGASKRSAEVVYDLISED